MTTNQGYVLLDRAGEFLAWAAHLEVALLRSRDRDIVPHLGRIERCADGAVMSFRRQAKKAPGERWDEAVPA